MSPVQSLRSAARMMRKRPLFTAVIILTLGICIGAVTAVFSIVDATLLRPLPYPEPDRIGLLVVRSQFKGQNRLEQDSQNGRAWLGFRDAVKSMDLAAYSDSVEQLNFSSGSRAEYVAQQRVGAGYFHVFGLELYLGREFTSEEDVPNGPNVVILSYEFWQRGFHGDRSLIGQNVVVAGQNYQVIGVASPQFESDADLWAPLRPSASGEGRGLNYKIVGRLQKGITRSQAESEIALIGQRILPYRNFPAGVTLQYGLASIKELAGHAYQTPLLIALAATIMVLLIGCVNIAGMLMAQGVSRSFEIATRMALGASRVSLVQQLLSESCVLAAAGGVLGIFLGSFGLDLMKSLLPNAFPSLSKATLDSRAIAATAAISVMTSILFGLFPALQTSRVDIRIAQAGGRTIAGARASFLRRALSTAQIAVAVAMLIGAGLLLRSYNYLWNLNPGFDPSNVLTASFALRDARYAELEQMNRYYHETLGRLQAIPGVESAAVTLSLPYDRALNMSFRIPGDAEGVLRITNVSYASPQFFDVFRIPILRGRGIADSDGPSSQPIAVVNSAFAKMHFKDRESIGTQLRFGGNAVQIVGVVGDVLQKAGWGRFGVMGYVPTVYIPSTQFRSDSPVHAWFSPSWAVRTARPIVNLQRQIEDAVKSVDPLLPIAAFRSVRQVKRQALAEQRFMPTLLGFAAGLALLLAVIGMYAMIANSVAERTREYGIQMALGATAGQIIRNSAKPGFLSAAIGLAIGLGIAQIGMRFLRGMLYGVAPIDSVTYIVVAIGIPGIAAAASLIPSLRISKLDPSQTLRQE